MKKYFRLVMAALLVLPMVAACGSDDELAADAASQLPQVSRAADDGSAPAEDPGDYIEVTDSMLANMLPDGVPGVNDLCGLSQVEFDVDRGEQVLEITSEKPFCVFQVRTRRWATLNDLSQYDESHQSKYFDWCERNEYKANPSSYEKEGELDFVRFERDSQTHLRVFLTENDTDGLRDCFIFTYDPTHVLFEGYVQPHNYGEIWIKQQAE